MEEKKLPLTEVISRYLFKGDFDSVLNVKPRAFKPSKKDRALSVYRTEAIDIPDCTTALTENEIWDLADQMIGARESKGGVIARSDFKVEYVLNVKLDLEVVENQEDHVRHAHIQPFPMVDEGASEEEKRDVEKARNTIGTRLASASGAILRAQK